MRTSPASVIGIPWVWRTCLEREKTAQARTKKLRIEMANKIFMRHLSITRRMEFVRTGCESRFGLSTEWLST
jgi:hypothetical protein